MAGSGYNQEATDDVPGPIVIYGTGGLLVYRSDVLALDAWDRSINDHLALAERTYVAGWDSLHHRPHGRWCIWRRPTLMPTTNKLRSIKVDAGCDSTALDECGAPEHDEPVRLHRHVRVHLGDVDR